MTIIPPITVNPQEPRTQRNSNQEQVAAGIGGAAGVSTAARYAGQRAIKAQEGERILQTTLETVQTASRNVTQNTSTLTRLFNNFRKNTAMFSANLQKRLGALKDVKFIKPILNSPITKKLTMGIGGVLAFFVLATEFNKAVQTGEVAIKDFKGKYDTYRNAA